MTGMLRSSGLPRNSIAYVRNRHPQSAIYNILNAATNYCQTEDMQLVINSYFILLGSAVFQLYNDIKNCNPNLWVIYANFKTTSHRYGHAYRLMASGEYRTFKGRLAGL